MVSRSQLPLVSVAEDSFLQCGPRHDVLIESVSRCGGGYVVIVVGGGWECETCLLLLFSSILFSKVTLARPD